MRKKNKLPRFTTLQGYRGLEKKQQSLRQRIHDAYFLEGLMRFRIRSYFHVSNRTVLRWTQATDQDCTVDHRGWPRGMRRTHSDETLDRIRQIHQDLSTNAEEFFTGASAIERE